MAGRMFKTAGALFAAVAVAGTTGVATASAAPLDGTASPAPLLDTAGATAVPGSYIVVLKDGTTTAAGARVAAEGASVAEVRAAAVSSAASAAERSGATVHQRWSHALTGFSAELTAAQLRTLRANPEVAYVQPNNVVTINTTVAPGGGVTAQAVGSWGLDRLDQADLPLDDTYTAPGDGSGVTAYIVDTGINTSHSDFGGRASVGFDAVGDGRNGIDCNGHGTHVSGTVGGTEYGVAKNVDLVGVRVLGCDGSGTTAGVVDRFDWVTENHSGPTVANMSLGGGSDPALDSAVAGAVSSGVVFAVAAGNDYESDACDGSPSGVPSAITVGSTTITDQLSAFSNVGGCVDILAPGSDITSDWIGGTSATNTISGTSMATPHVAGAAALLLEQNPSASPSSIASALEDAAVQDAVSGVPSDTVNLLLQVG